MIYHDGYGNQQFTNTGASHTRTIFNTKQGTVITALDQRFVMIKKLIRYPV